jgi:histidyl-tRNA synthetase
MLTQAPKGTADVYGADMRIWKRVESEIRSLTEVFGFSEIRVPMFEHTELFMRGVGDTTDIVQKEMYTFTDKGGRSLSLRPEQTAGVARAYVEQGMHNQPQPTRLYYVGPNFRYEKPQAGRYRQHSQFGIELFGSYNAAADAEVISLGHTLLNRLGVKNVTLYLNSIGCDKCRPVYQRRLKDFLAENLADLCSTCRERFEKNPLRILDCKVPSCNEIVRNAPSVLDSLDDECRAHFEELQRLLTEMGIPFVIDARVVRGLDYYTRTVFEFIEGGQTRIGGGRYDGLIGEVGGNDTGAVGFGMGMERLVLLLKEQGGGAAALEDAGADVFIGSADETGRETAQLLAYRLRIAGVKAEADVLTRSVKAQMKYADKTGARYSVVLGGNEVAGGAAELKEMKTGAKHNVALDDVNAWREIINRA